MTTDKDTVTEEHQHTSDCHHDQPESSTPALEKITTQKMMEMISRQQQEWQQHKARKRLQSINYNEKSKKYKNSYILQHKKSGLIAEIRAASSLHACRMLNWNPKRVRLLSTKIITEPSQPAEAITDATSHTDTSTTHDAPLNSTKQETGYSDSVTQNDHSK